MRYIGMLLAHVGFEELVLPEFKATVLESADISARAVVAINVTLSVEVGGKSIRAASHGAGEWFLSTVNQLVTRKMVRAAERLSTVLMLARVRLHSGVFTQMCVELPLFVVGRSATLKRTEITLGFLSFALHFP